MGGLLSDDPVGSETLGREKRGSGQVAWRVGGGHRFGQGPKRSPVTWTYLLFMFFFVAFLFFFFGLGKCSK